MPGEQGHSKQEPSGIPSQSSPREKDPGSIRRDIPSEKQEILQTSPSPTADSSGKKDLLKGEQNSKEHSQLPSVSVAKSHLNEEYWNARIDISAQILLS